VAEQKRGPTDSSTERLRAESGRNRIEFLRNELQTCFTFAGLVDTEQGEGDSEHAARSLAHAEKGYATLVHFMSDPKHVNLIPEAERVELSAGIQRLRDQLDELRNEFL
jgi:hypothetical protein